MNLIRVLLEKSCVFQLLPPAARTQWKDISSVLLLTNDCLWAQWFGIKFSGTSTRESDSRCSYLETLQVTLRSGILQQYGNPSAGQCNSWHCSTDLTLWGSTIKYVALQAAKTISLSSSCKHQTLPSPSTCLLSPSTEIALKFTEKRKNQFHLFTCKKK